MDWEICNVFFSRRLIDGTHANGRLMRRYVNGVAQYRRLTDQEEFEHMRDIAW